MCVNYKNIKTKLEFEQALITLPDKDRINLCRFRCGNHKLPVHKRYLRHDTDNKCSLCNLNNVGDEFHYLFICPRLNLERERLLKKYYFTRPNVLKMYELFNTGSNKEKSNLAHFVSKIMSLF